MFPTTPADSGVMGPTLIVGYFVFLFFLSFAKALPIRGRFFFLLRAFVPSWKFFEELGTVPELQCRIKRGSGEFEDWFYCLLQPKRSLTSLFLNPQGNLVHASQNHLFHLIDELCELENPESISGSVSYKVTENLVEYRLKHFFGLESGDSYQFKIMSKPLATPLDVQDQLISTVYEY